VFSVPSKCGFLNQFGTIFFLNIRPKWSRAEEPTPVEGVSKDSTCHSFFYTSPSSSNFLSFYYSVIFVVKKLFEKVLYKIRNIMEVK